MKRLYHDVGYGSVHARRWEPFVVGVGSLISLLSVDAEAERTSMGSSSLSSFFSSVTVEVVGGSGEGAPKCSRAKSFLGSRKSRSSVAHRACNNAM